jgi:hypothetical protein
LNWVGGSEFVISPAHSLSLFFCRVSYAFPNTR